MDAGRGRRDPARKEAHVAAFDVLASYVRRIPSGEHGDGGALEALRTHPRDGRPLQCEAGRSQAGFGGVASMSEQGGRVPTQERRSAPRSTIQVPVEYEDSVTGRGSTEDMSLSGVRIEHVSSVVPTEEELRLRFSLFSGSFETLFEGKVVRHTKEGFAIQFWNLDVAQLAALRRALPLDLSV